MKKALCLLFLFIAAAHLSFPQEKNREKIIHGKTIPEKSIQGKASNPLFLPDGNIFFLYNTAFGELRSASQNKIEGLSSTSALPLNNFVSTLILKKDRLGNLWAAWVEETGEKSEIYYGRINNQCLSLVSRTLIASSETILSPSLYFDLNNNPWLAWLDYSRGECTLKVTKINDDLSQQSWRINYSSITEASSPKIIVDNLNQVWIFWTGKKGQGDDIFCLTYNGLSWSNPTNLTSENPFPDILPQAGIDGNGRLWLVWSGYDGSNYEIFYCFQDGSGWSAIKKITDNSRGDLFPSLTFVSETIPVVAWSQPQPGKQVVLASYLLEGQWSSPAEIFQTETSSIIPRLTASFDQIALLLQCGDEILSLKLTLSELFPHKNKKDPPPLSSSSTAAQAPPIAVNSLLEENHYTAFGDSITYGYLDYHPAPELGYIPRLDEIMDQHYGDTEIINEGRLGETTPNGLSRFDDVLTTYSSQYLLLKEGTNDIIFHEISTDTSEFNIREMVRKAKNYGVLILLATIIPRNDWRWGIIYYKERIYELNRRIRDIAKNERVPLIDLFEIFFNYPQEDGGWTSLLSEDNVHPSEKGYQLMAESWFSEIDNLPFPPQNIRVERLENGSGSEAQELNLVTWKDNSKIADISKFSAYGIYRRDSSNPESSYQLVKSKRIFKGDAAVQGSIGSPNFISFSNRYLDLGISPDRTYEYAVSLIRRDKVEGPPKSGDAP